MCKSVAPTLATSGKVYTIYIYNFSTLGPILLLLLLLELLQLLLLVLLVRGGVRGVHNVVKREGVRTRKTDVHSEYGSMKCGQRGGENDFIQYLQGPSIKTDVRLLTYNNIYMYV